MSQHLPKPSKKWSLSIYWGFLFICCIVWTYRIPGPGVFVLQRKHSAVIEVKQKAQEVLGEGEHHLDEANQLSENINKEIEVQMLAWYKHAIYTYIPLSSLSREVSLVLVSTCSDMTCRGCWQKVIQMILSRFSLSPSKVSRASPFSSSVGPGGDARRARASSWSAGW